MKKFHLDRREDMTGVVGTGVVAEGVVFEDGTAVLRWRSTGDVAAPSVAVWPGPDAMANIETVHCHHGATSIVYDD